MTTALLLLAFGPNGQLHLHVDGDGMFRFARGSQAVYSADVVLSTSSGVLTTSEGYPLLPQIRVPADGIGIHVEMDGTVTVSGKTAGRIVLASFWNAPTQKLGAFVTSSSRSTIGYPGEGVFGVVRTLSGTRQSSPASSATASKATPQNIGCSIEVAFHSETDQPDILLGEISTITGSGSEKEAVAGIDLGATPIYGAVRGISRVYILARLRNQGIDTSKIEIICPSGATVVRKGQRVDEDAMVAAAADGARTKLGIDYQLREDHSQQELWVPTGDIQFNVRGAAPQGDGASVEVEIDVDGKAAGRRTIGLLPTTKVAQVHIGDPVKVRVIKNGAVVEVAGKARSGGRIGSSITVETDGQVVFTGIVVSTSLVEVKL
jgi:hypothetical protein